MTRPPESRKQQLVAKAAGNESINGHATTCDDKKQAADNNATTNQQWEQQRLVVAGDKTARGQRSTIGGKSGWGQQQRWSHNGIQ
jgi:hypothetical protein